MLAGAGDWFKGENVTLGEGEYPHPNPLPGPERGKGEEGKGWGRSSFDRLRMSGREVGQGERREALMSGAGNH